MKMNIYGVVMAGGGGTRFWPLSRHKRPKQLLNLSGKNLMINETVDRIGRFIPFNNIFIVTNKDQTESMVSALKGRISSENIISEPVSRNTAACIGYAAIKIIELFGDGIMCVTPADHCVSNLEMFEKVMIDAVNEVQKRDALVTIGIEPTFPATGFGYINFDKTDETVSKKVSTFVEKPDLDTAAHYVESGEYLWNSGMFIWKASVILNEIKKHLPELYSGLVKLSNIIKLDSDDYIVIENIYKDLQDISIDYGILEKSNIVRVIPASFDWHDVGSWDMMNVLHKEDNNGNICIGDVIDIDTINTTVYSNGRLVAVVGVRNSIIVETSDAILVCDRSHAQDVKKVVEILKQNGRHELL